MSALYIENHLYIKPLDIENDYMYHKKAQYVENFNDFLIMVFLSIVFQTSYEKMFYCKKRIRLTKLISISTKYYGFSMVYIYIYKYMYKYIYMVNKMN